MHRAGRCFAALSLFLAAHGCVADSTPSNLRSCKAHVAHGSLEASILSDSGRGLPPLALPAEGEVLWLVCTLVLGAGPPPNAIQMTALASYELYFDGHFLGRSGVPALEASDHVAGPIDVVFPLPPEWATVGEHQIAVLFARHGPSSPVASEQRLQYGFAIGDITYLAQDQLRWSLPALMCLNLLLVIGLYYAILFYLERTSIEKALFSGLSLAMAGLGLAEAVRGLVIYPYPYHGWRLLIIACLTGLVCTLWVGFVAYTLKIGRGAHLTFAMPGVAVVCYAVTPHVDWGGAALFAFTLVVGGIATLVGVVHGRRLAKPMLGAFLLSTLMLAHDKVSFQERGLTPSFMAFVVIMLLALAHDQRLVRQARDQATARSTRLENQLLKQSIQPHFLMNSLNAISEWVEEDPDVAVKAINFLAEELHLITTVAHHKLIPLEQEIALCRLHCQVMSFRLDREFGLIVRGQASGSIPPAVLHTALENAFTHHRYPAGRTNFRLDVSTDRDLELRIELWAPPGVSRRRVSSGTGGAYIRARLREAYGDGFLFDSREGPSGGWLTQLTVPAARAE